MTPLNHTAASLLYIGAPVWACDQWKGTLFTEKAPRSQWLPQYSSVFNTVEGNSTFYGLPALSTVRRWADDSGDGFRFALKFPRTISYDRRLRNAERDTAAFLEIVETLAAADRLGPSFLQLPPDFSPAEADALEAYLRSLPSEYPWAVEVRHYDWYDDGDAESRLDDLLRELEMDKVLFDSRPLFSKPPSDEIEEISQSRKPRTPIRQTVTGRHPFLRFVGRNTIQEADRWIDEWAIVIASWIRDGLKPFLFTHAPNDRFAPEFARRMHSRIRKVHPALPPLADWPGETAARDKKSQGLLF